MSKRITLTEDDVKILIRLVERAANAVTPYNDMEFMAVQRRNQLLDKLKTEPLSQKVSSDSDETIITDKARS